MFSLALRGKSSSFLCLLKQQLCDWKANSVHHLRSIHLLLYLLLLLLMIVNIYSQENVFPRNIVIIIWCMFEKTHTVSRRERKGNSKLVQIFLSLFASRLCCLSYAARLHFFSVKNESSSDSKHCFSNSYFYLLEHHHKRNNS
jgi:hypothetical protein